MRIGSNRMRLVLIIITYLLFIPAGNTASFSKYKSTCSDIGFTPDTDPFADCVLKLYKRDKAKVKAETIKDNNRQDSIIKENNRQTQLEEERLRIERQRLALEKRRYKEQEKRAKQKAINEQFQREQRGFDALKKLADEMQKDVDRTNAQNNKSNAQGNCYSTCIVEGLSANYCASTCY